ncbi:MAG: PAS domain-containing protein [Rhodospirillaceae bacterium]|nr:PAS domain-containing protein [Rhodospirillaceae bacterium]
MARSGSTELATTATFEAALDRASTLGRIWMEHWRSLAPTGALPRRDQLDPTGIPQLLGDMSIMERESPDMIHLRLVGTGIVDRIGFDPTGKNIFDVHNYKKGEEVSAHLNFVLDEPCGQIVTLTDTYSSGRKFTVDICRLPMADRAGVPRYIVAVARSRFFSALEFVQSEPQILAEVMDTTFFTLPSAEPAAP